MLSHLAQCVWSYGCARGLLRRRDRILLAVSGGADSMAMLGIMRELADRYRLVLRIAHIDHGLRGAESDRDRRFMMRYARLIGVPASAVRVTIGPRRMGSGSSFEEAARSARYAALERIRRRFGMRVIATAHHADDQIETILMRIIRGTDLKGLAGILPARSHPPVIRPLLSCRHRELVLYLDDQRIPYREDSTNEDVRYTRNRIRHRIIPDLLRHGYRELLADIPHLAESAGRLNTMMRRLIPDALNVRTDMPRGHRQVTIDALRALTPGVRRSFVSMLLDDSMVPLSTDRIARVIRLMDQLPGKRVRFQSAGAEILRDRHALVFGPLKPGRPSPVHLGPGGSVSLPGGTVKAGRPGSLPRTFRSGNSGIWVDASRVTGGLVVRPWKPGDRMLPLGMAGKSKKVSDILRDAHVPLFYKESVPVVTCRGRIVWVCGIRQDERFKLTHASVSALKLSFHSNIR